MGIMYLPFCCKCAWESICSTDTNDITSSKHAQTNKQTSKQVKSNDSTQWFFYQHGFNKDNPNKR
jgi:hypothetical protein